MGAKAIRDSKNPSSGCYYTNENNEPQAMPREKHKTFPFINQGTIVIRNGTLWTAVSSDLCEGCDILVEDGQISKIGKNLEAPEGAEEYPAYGAFITPGLVDMHSHAAVAPFPDDAVGSLDGNGATNPDTPQVRTIDAIDPNDPAIPLILSGGVTTSLILPGSLNLISGQATHVKMRGGSVENMTIKGVPITFKMATGENPKRTYGSRDQLPSTRMGNAWGFRRVFAEANALKIQQDQWDCIAAKGVKQQESRPYNAYLAPLVSILRNEALLNVHCYEVQDFESMLRVADEFGFQITAFHHALEAYESIL